MLIAVCLNYYGHKRKKETEFLSIVVCTNLFTNYSINGISTIKKDPHLQTRVF
jgi:hypothetical protein